MDRQLTIAGADEEERAFLPEAVLNDELPYSIGGRNRTEQIMHVFPEKPTSEKFRLPYGPTR